MLVWWWYCGGVVVVSLWYRFNCNVGCIFYTMFCFSCVCGLFCRVCCGVIDCGSLFHCKWLWHVLMWRLLIL